MSSFMFIKHTVSVFITERILARVIINPLAIGAISSVLKMSTISQEIGTDLGAMRMPYKADALIELAEKHPVALFEKWFKLACDTDGIVEANAMALCTADKRGKPSARNVLLKGFNREGFHFFTNYESRKGKELAENPFASLLFYWAPLNKQIRIEGTVERLSGEDSDIYFISRPISSQVSAIISEQSTVIENREVLIEKKKDLECKLQTSNGTLTRPPYWGGYRVIPNVMEFWQGQTDRLHDRIRFRHLSPGENIDTKITNIGVEDWVYERLSP